MKKIIPMSNIEFIRNALTVPKKRTSIFKSPFGDKDKDKVPNFRDCAPLNPRKHGVEPSKIMAQKYKRLPIFVTEEPIPKDIFKRGEEPLHTYHFLSKEARKKAPKARKVVLGTLKRAPSLVGELKRKRPGAVYLTTSETPEYLGYATSGTKEIVLAAPSSEIKEEVVGEIRSMGIKRPEAAERAITLRHELEHIKQFRKARKKREAKLRRMSRIPYEEQSAEKGAYRAGEKQLIELEDYQYGEEISPEEFGKMFK